MHSLEQITCALLLLLFCFFLPIAGVIAVHNAHSIVVLLQKVRLGHCGTPATGLNGVVCACVLNVFLIILFVSYCIASGMCVSCFGTEHYFVWCKIM